MFLIKVSFYCDLLWADPDKETNGWGENDSGVSFTFGPEIVSKFLTKHGLDLVVWGHQVVEDGYELDFCINHSHEGNTT